MFKRRMPRDFTQDGYGVRHRLMKINGHMTDYERFDAIKDNLEQFLYDFRYALHKKLMEINSEKRATTHFVRVSAGFCIAVDGPISDKADLLLKASEAAGCLSEHIERLERITTPNRADKVISQSLRDLAAETDKFLMTVDHLSKQPAADTSRGLFTSAIRFLQKLVGSLFKVEFEAMKSETKAILDFPDDHRHEFKQGEFKIK